MNVTAVSTPSWPRFNRRDFLRLSTLAAAGWLSGCAANPVTGKSQLMLVSEQEEIQLDRQYSPRQFSSDYGVTQDQALNAYISQTGVRLASLSHRPQMPYRFQVVNATYVNAYDHFQMPWSQEAEDRMRAFLATNPRDKHGAHRYALEDFGLELGAIRERFADYCKRSDVPLAL